MCLLYLTLLKGEYKHHLGYPHQIGKSANHIPKIVHVSSRWDPLI